MVDKITATPVEGTYTTIKNSNIANGLAMRDEVIDVFRVISENNGKEPTWRQLSHEFDNEYWRENDSSAYADFTSKASGSFSTGFNRFSDDISIEEVQSYFCGELVSQDASKQENSGLAARYILEAVLTAGCVGLSFINPFAITGATLFGSLSFESGHDLMNGDTDYLDIIRAARKDDTKFDVKEYEFIEKEYSLRDVFIDTAEKYNKITGDGKHEVNVGRHDDEMAEEIVKQLTRQFGVIQYDKEGNYTEEYGQLIADCLEALRANQGFKNTQATYDPKTQTITDFDLEIYTIDEVLKEIVTMSHDSNEVNDRLYITYEHKISDTEMTTAEILERYMLLI